VCYIFFFELSNWRTTALYKIKAAMTNFKEKHELWLLPHKPHENLPTLCFTNLEHHNRKNIFFSKFLMTQQESAEIGLWWLSVGCGGSVWVVVAHSGLWWLSRGLWWLSVGCGGSVVGCGGSVWVVVARLWVVVAQRGLWWLS
jgi:hypothetical protein